MKKAEWLECIACGDEILIKRLKLFEGTLVKCTECGLVFRNPRPSYETIKKFYKEECSNIFFEEKIKSYRKGIFHHFLATSIKDKGKGRLLDMGCGYGIFLNLAKDQGWEVYGLELSEDASQFARKNFGLNVFCGDLKEASFPKDYFGVVTLWNVLDHTTNPLEQLLEIKRILKDDGLIFIRVPNFLFQGKSRCIGEALDKLFLGNTYLSRKISVSHLYAFTPFSITSLLESAGFSIFRLRNAPPAKGDPYGAFPFLGDRLMNWIKNSFFIICELLYYLSIGKILWGPSMEVFAYKEQKF
jgi:SAM-dependent methyltransferase